MPGTIQRAVKGCKFCFDYRAKSEEFTGIHKTFYQILADISMYNAMGAVEAIPRGSKRSAISNSCLGCDYKSPRIAEALKGEKELEVSTESEEFSEQDAH